MKKPIMFRALLAVLPVVSIQVMAVNAGECKGEGERVVLYLEYLLRRAEVHLNQKVNTVSLGLVDSRRLLPDAGRLIVSFRARWLLLEGLHEAENQPQGAAEKITENITKVALATGNDPETKAAGKESAMLLRQAVDQALIQYAFCRAAADDDPARCQLLSFDEKAQRVCRDLVYQIDIYIRGNCQAERIKAMAEEAKIPEDSLAEACRILAARNMEQCEKLGSFRTRCRAIIADDENECSVSGGPEREVKGCLNELHNIRLLRGKDTVSDKARDDFFYAASVGLNEPDSCRSHALETWSAFTGDFFRL